MTQPKLVMRPTQPPTQGEKSYGRRPPRWNPRRTASPEPAPNRLVGRPVTGSVHLNDFQATTMSSGPTVGALPHNPLTWTDVVRFILLNEWSRPVNVLAITFPLHVN